MASHIRTSLMLLGVRNACAIANTERCISGVLIPVRHLSRMRTRTGNKGGFWIDRLAPPLFDRTAIERKLDENPDSRFDKVAPARIFQSSSAFSDPLVTKFTNMMMLEGMKDKAEEMMGRALKAVKTIQLDRYHAADESTKPTIILNPIKIFHKAVENCKPVLALAPLKRGGVTYQVPVSILEKKAEWTSMKWLILAGRDHDQKTDKFRNALARELIAASNNEGKVIKRKFDLHKQCEANKAYAHYRWSK
ncbi:putative 28S ribosomal protein S7, mitochondrial [Hypsibius exemplaris]|uniref:28S ribosomal protein S7, mitochondrial n=1 Tax=Hypsibius exemplaris TaxID=2072580 RepID=A0A9X6RKR2_HYPEX|nr:putative 28S ribosomal protein S7, mitochondrial [Hypsibius exemplaris]